ncbi:glycoside hydrolase family 15 [Sphingomonas sp. Leaf407]|uniref:glycoside hydrolase family 15 protein n=1 Tax=unclassified Sphingomonas TaxID=196159 RepID=UPI0006FA341F|nr:MULTISPECIES: glycoside hydrolase family 15 protein [unclassified Sphingomonas]KQN34813.1 glycoside hydrolase family 15 [Sphingomonas sp. Leaf42]KQT25365.1 glycoside hydrolase family 15 [Sphingomonas sp. Leaf407]
MFLRSSSASAPASLRDTDGYLPLARYGALGDGRAVVLSGADGSIDWWCVPNMDSPPLFDRLLDAGQGGYFAITPAEPFTSEQRYRDNSNVLETIFTTATGRAKLVESLNSGTAGRLPWAELARRVEGLDGRVAFTLTLRFGRRADTVSPYFARAGGHDVFHVGAVLGLVRCSDNVTIDRQGDDGIDGRIAVAPGERATIGIVAGADEPLVVPTIEAVDERIDLSDKEWRDWTQRLHCVGDHRATAIRSALALKLLLYSPSGAIVAAATTSLPERIGGTKNWDYRYAWIRDAGYTIKAFLRIGALGEAKAGFTWLLKRLGEGAPRVCYTLAGDRVPDERRVDLPGYRGSQPVVAGNLATNQHQHGIYGDIFETAERFVACGNILDSTSAETLSHLADQCADRWRQKDAGIWELEEAQHYTMSKISCWQALERAVELADAGQLPTTCRDRWARERDRIMEWIGEHCWSEERGAYLCYPGADGLDASLALAVRFRFDGQDRLARTLDAIDRELGAGAYHYRYTGMDKEEGCFLACTFWMVEARAILGQHDRAAAAFEAAMAGLADGVGILPEMIDPKTHEYLGNLPQGLSHLALIQAIATLNGTQL